MTNTPDNSGGTISQATTITDLQEALGRVRAAGQSVGLVPTMGALHEGHLSLVRRAHSENDFVVVSVFVNPTQFSPDEDFNQYPRDLDQDIRLAAEAGAHLVFAPEVDEMYPPGYCTWVDVEGLTEGLCGATREGHFRGVSTVVAKLFNLCRPDRAYFGQKDAQQLVVIRRMVRDLNMGVEVVACPTVRESDGLALNSRNAYLNPEERAQAALIYTGLRKAEELVAGGEYRADRVEATIREVLLGAPLAEIEYIVVVNVDDLEPLPCLQGDCLVALAVYFGNTRLIDNTIVQV